MGMSTHVVGFKPADETWLKMKAVYDACRSAEIKMPDAVLEFFGYTAPDSAGVEIDKEALFKCGALSEWSRDGAEGFEVEISKLPPHVKTIRFFNSW